MVVSQRFRAFDSEITLCAISENEKVNNTFKKIQQDAQDFENRFSRFIVSSELNKINNKSRDEIKVSDEMLKVLLEAKKAKRMTNGLFDPTIHSVLSRSGYDKTFDSLKNLKNDKKVSEKIDEKKSSFEEFSINEKDKTISSPPGLKIDLGGIAKGFWVDKMKDLLDKQCNDYWISAGGDIFIKGKDEKDECWQVAVQNPLKLDEDLLYLNIPDGGFGIATSGVTKRQWIKNGKKRNHLIDIRTNTQVKNSILSVTVIAKTTTDADVMAKTVLILGIKKGLALVHSIQDYECVIIDKNLKMFISNGLKKFL